MKRWIAGLLLLLPIPGQAKEQLRKFRWAEPSPGERNLNSGVKADSTRLLPGVGELVSREGQMVGRAKVAGAWKQTVLDPAGKMIYAAGALADNAPPSLGALGVSELALTESLTKALGRASELRGAGRVFPPSLELKMEGGKWLPYWRVEFLTPAGDQLRYLTVLQDGSVSGSRQIAWDGVDGRALVYTDGPREGAAREEVLRDLTGDGTVTGRLLHVVSALDLKVWSPELTFFFPASDRRFDLGQAYFSIDRGFRWLRDHLGVGIDHPVEVKLHVGNEGVSNAAFYHQNTIYLGTGDNVTYKDMIKDPSVLIHEGIHAVIDAYAGLPSEGEGGSFNEGFADLFTALILDNPRMGEASYLKGPYRRTLEHNLQAYRDFNTGVYQNGSIVAATFWDMKAALGTELTAKLAFRTLVRLGKGARFDDFSAALASAADGLLGPDQARYALDTARNRGWRAP